MLIERIIYWTFITGIICRIIPDRVKYIRETISFLTVSIVFILSIYIFRTQIPSPEVWYYIDKLSAFVFLFVSFFSILVVIYSFSYMKGREFLNRYYAYILWTLSASTGAIFSNHLITFAIFWGFLALTLYLLVNLGGADAALPAKKTFIIVGGVDSFLLLGIAIMYHLTGTFFMSEMSITIRSGISIAAFLSLVAASFAKAGAMPLHTWIPEISESAPVSVLAFLPACLDKLIGIYFLVRICGDIFNFNPGMWFILRLLGSITIVAAVFMALIQHNIKKLLSYHAVSQVGYMILGIGTGNPVGIAGGIFHMLNNAIYKSGLFLSTGIIEEKTGTSELEKLGGLSKFLPITFFSFLIASLAISGVPPLNGFFSKWMVYQGLFLGAKTGGPEWAIWIIAAMIGSALTLASFLKLIHSIFLGHSKKYEGIKEGPVSLILPGFIIALMCIIFGFGYNIVVEKFIPVEELNISSVEVLLPSLFLIVIALISGGLIYLVLNSIKVRRGKTFVGGEKLRAGMEMSGTEFYRTIEELPLFSRIYQGAKNKVFDIYEVGKGIVFYFSGILRSLHTGILPNYVSWVLFACLILFLIFIKG